MQPQRQPGALPLDCASEIIVELQLLRSECCLTADQLTRRTPLDEPGLEECARLDDALAQAHRLLLGVVREIKRLRRLRAK